MARSLDARGVSTLATGVSTPATVTNTSYDALKEKSKVAIWMMSSFLFLYVAWRAGVEEIMPPEFVFLLWTSSELFTVSGCYWFFIYRVPNSNSSGKIMRGVLWVFAVILNVVFPLQKMKSFSPELAIIVFFKSGFVIIGGFYKLFLWGVRQRSEQLLPC